MPGKKKLKKGKNKPKLAKSPKIRKLRSIGQKQAKISDLPKQELMQRAVTSLAQRVGDLQEIEKIQQPDLSQTVVLSNEMPALESPVIQPSQKPVLETIGSVEPSGEKIELSLPPYCHVYACLNCNSPKAIMSREEKCDRVFENTAHMRTEEGVGTYRCGNYAYRGSYVSLDLVESDQRG